MLSAWLLPEHVADVLPSEARHIEELRRAFLDAARGYGFELVMPPLLEHLESLLSGADQALDLRTFKLVDQLSGRTIGVRADTTPQVARIDAHLLNREGVTRLCYCGPVLHTRPYGLHATREPLQAGAEIYGHRGLEADLEVIELALDSLSAAAVGPVVLDLADVRFVRGLLGDAVLSPAARADLSAALLRKDAAAVEAAASSLSAEQRAGFKALVALYGDESVLAEAAQSLPASADGQAALADLQWLVSHIKRSHPGVRLSFDLASASGNAYYSGVHFAIYAPGAPDALARGGRYDEVGSVFGRNRPAVGFSLDVKGVASQAQRPAHRRAVRAPWGEDGALRDAIRQLRQQGETVVCVLPGHEHETDEFDCDRELVAGPGGGWHLQPR